MTWLAKTKIRECAWIWRHEFDPHAIVDKENARKIQRKLTKTDEQKKDSCRLTCKQQLQILVNNWENQKRKKRKKNDSLTPNTSFTKIDSEMEERHDISERDETNNTNHTDFQWIRETQMWKSAENQSNNDGHEKTQELRIAEENFHRGNANSNVNRKRRGRLTRVKALGNSGGVAEELVAERTSHACRHRCSLHLNHHVSFHCSPTTRL